MRDIHRAALAKLKEYGVTGQLIHGRRHPRIIFMFNGREHQLIVPGTTSDPRGARLDMLARLRRILAPPETRHPVMTQGKEARR